DGHHGVGVAAGARQLDRSRAAAGRAEAGRRVERRAAALAVVGAREPVPGERRLDASEGELAALAGLVEGASPDPGGEQQLPAGFDLLAQRQRFAVSGVCAGEQLVGEIEAAGERLAGLGLFAALTLESLGQLRAGAIVAGREIVEV